MAAGRSRSSRRRWSHVAMAAMRDAAVTARCPQIRASRPIGGDAAINAAAVVGGVGAAAIRKLALRCWLAARWRTWRRRATTLVEGARWRFRRRD